MSPALILGQVGRLTMAAALAVAATLGAGVAVAQSTPPALPSMTAEQSGQVSQALALYRADTEARVGRGEITPDEAELLIAWRQWQLAQQVTGQAPPPPAPPQATDRPPVVVAPYPYSGAPTYVSPYYAAPYYPAPYYGPYYAPPAPYYWGFSLCGGRGYRHGWAGFCI